jgi:hypothetical protein
METQISPDVWRLGQIYNTGVLWQCMCAMARLEVPDRLADGPRALPELAAAAEVEEQHLLRVLRFLADNGLVTLDGHIVALTPLGRLLRKDHPSSMWAMFAAPGIPDLMHALVDTLRTGRPAAEQVLGVSFWKYLESNPAAQEIFDEQMRRHSTWLAGDCVPALDWPDTGTVADIGGGVGTLLAAVLRTSPELRGILTDQSHVLERARPFLAAEGLADRCEARPADLFDTAPPADVYLLAYVLHDWPDADAARILRAIGMGAAENSVLRIFEYLIPADGSPHSSKMSDIGLMLLLGGRERTASELEHLLERTGWRLTRIAPVSWQTSLIEARPAPR